METISLFSGCGGSDLGASRAGATVVLANDNWKAATATYRTQLSPLLSAAPELVSSDVREIRVLPRADLVIGCYPCQSFSMGGARNPSSSELTDLYLEFARCLELAKPKFFVAENVPGLGWLSGGDYLTRQEAAFRTAGDGYLVTSKIVNARDYGVPADRRRLFIVGVRRDLGLLYRFPDESHGPNRPKGHASHGEAISDLPLHPPTDDYYSYRRPDESWWYMSRNRRRPWSKPSLTIIGNWRHIPLHPASPPMRLESSDLANKSRQTWAFGEHDSGATDHERLATPRRLTWQEAARLQTFPRGFEPVGSIQSKFQQIGNAVPPRLMEEIVRPIVSGSGLVNSHPDEPF